MSKKEKACLVDTTKCIGCRACQVACKHSKSLPAEQTKFQGRGGGYENPPALSTKTYCRITFHEVLDNEGNLDRSVFVKRQCMHCREPGCVSACLVKALEKTPEGPVVWREDLCMGCRYCMIACPFDIPKFEYDKAVPSIRKCPFCSDRIQRGKPVNVELNSKPLTGKSLTRYQDSCVTPSCVKACPTGALKHGGREELLEVARTRIYQNPDEYVHHIYGEHEVGGTNWLYITNVPFEKLGFATGLPTTPIPEYTKDFLNAVPLVIILGAGLGTGLHWFTKRREEVAKSEAVNAEHKKAQS